MATATLDTLAALRDSIRAEPARRAGWLDRPRLPLGVLRPLNRAVQAIERVIYPPLCLSCDVDLADASEGFCTECLGEMIAIDEPACPRCAARVGRYSTADGCARCRGLDLRFDAAVRLGHYAGKLREQCLSFKSVHNALVGPAFARLFERYNGDRLRELNADMIVAVPLHFARRLRRGFNQAESLARSFARMLHVPHRSRILKRVRRTRPQSELKRDERRDNVRDAFRTRAAKDLQRATVLLVDDILTTGATCSDAARALKAAGASRVIVAVIARSQE